MKQFNTMIERSFFFFPFAVVFVTLASMIVSLRQENLSCVFLGFFLSLLIPYILPLVTFKMFCFFYPLKEGRHPLISEKGICAWTVTFQIQRLFIIFPQMEFMLMTLPGLFSFWLRLWGSKVGKNVNWINTVVTDRSGLVIGDNVFFGNQCYLSAHVAMMMNQKLILYFKNITVESNTFIGASVIFPPGTRVPGLSVVPAKVFLKINGTFSPEEKHSPGNRAL